MSANGQEFVRALIDMYRSLPCLWKIKSADYSNFYKRKAAYEKLEALYKQHHPTETVDENIVRKKIQALRTVYKKEVNKVEKSMKSGAGTDVYVPKLWYYDLLAFTRDQEIPRPCQTVTSLCAPSADEILPESPYEHMSANGQEFVRALIDMYRSLPCLWKIKSADYSNRYKRKAAYEKLEALYKQHHPTETVDENIVRKKIQALRTVYKKEVNKVEKSMKSGAGTYVPKLWYYDLLAFTRDQEIPRPCQTVTSLCAPSAEEILPESPDEHVPPEQLPEGNNDETPQSSLSPCVEEQTRPQRPSRKRKATAGTPVDLLALASNIMTQHATTQLTGFPSFVVERLNKLDSTQRTHAERVMFEVLNAAAAGKLTETSMFTCSDRQPSGQFYWGHQQDPHAQHSCPQTGPTSFAVPDTTSTPFFW
ncbi:uncharacterized protein LOC143766243 isoform X2 [Ranitomeya variabilis]